MTTFTINFTDLIGNFWTMDWKPSTSKNKNLTDSDIHAVVHFIKYGNWPKSATSAAKNCYDSLAAEIANIIVTDTVTSLDRSIDLYSKIAHGWLDHKFSKRGNDLCNQVEKFGQRPVSHENTLRIKKLLKKIIKSENLFAIKFADDENWLVDVSTEMKCCICGKPIANDRQSHNPYPVRPESWYGDKENRCCPSCNQRIVIPSRIRYGRTDKNHRAMMKLDYEELLNFVA